MLSLNELARNIGNWRESKGFYTPTTLETQDHREAMLGKLMLVVTEVAEAAEAVRHTDIDNFREEIADTFIRLLDICDAMEIDPEDIILKKMEINRGRPTRHNKDVSL